MSKFNFTKTIGKIQATMKNDKRRADQFGLGNSLESVSTDPKDYIVLPQWWQDSTGVMGLKYGHFVQISGDPDSGKTSLSLLAIKAAQDQGNAVIYVETEGKTSPEDLEAAGIDCDGVITIHTKIVEEAFDNLGTAIDGVFADFPDAKLLVVFDSYGNTLSMRDSAIVLTEKSSLVGGAAKINRMGISSLASRQMRDPIAVLIVNYNYDNLGGVGKTNSGGKALDFHCMLILQSQRTAWYERTIAGEKVRAGADVKWRITKNHYSKSLKNEAGEPILLPKEINLRISADGIQPVKKA